MNADSTKLMIGKQGSEGDDMSRIGIDQQSLLSSMGNNSPFS
jgi:hypothetical protein